MADNNEMGNPLVWTIIGVLLTIGTLVGNVLYRSGHLSARVEELEKWRENIRQDMHEISEKLETQNLTLNRLVALIEERTERRIIPRPARQDMKKE